MRYFIFFISFMFLVKSAQSEQILRWNLIPLNKEDYENVKNEGNCNLFSEVIKNASNEWPHIIPYKFSEQTLKYFLLGYNSRESLEADIVTVWPEYRERIAKWYVLIGNENCFVKWFDILPNDLQDIIDIGFKKSD